MQPPSGGKPPVLFAPPGNAGQPANGATYSFDFRGSDIDNILKFYSQISNMTVAKDPALTGQATILSPKPLTLDEAFDVLQSVLFVRGFTAVADSTGHVLSIVPMDRALGMAPLVTSGKADARNEVTTQVIPLENVDADSLAKEFEPLINKGAKIIGSPETNTLIITDTNSNIRRIRELVIALDKAFNDSELRVFALKHAEATEVSDQSGPATWFSAAAAAGRPSRAKQRARSSRLRPGRAYQLCHRRCRHGKHEKGRQSDRAIG
jgi:general secretion pathway protein D